MIKKEQRTIRPLSICIFIHDGRLLVVKHVDKTDGSFYFRPPGGGIKFQESSKEAIIREIKEELGVLVSEPKLLGVMEDVYFQFEKVSHQHVFVYAATAPSELVHSDNFKFEDGGNWFEARWISLSSFDEKIRLVPTGLHKILNCKNAPVISYNHYDRK